MPSRPLSPKQLKLDIESAYSNINCIDIPAAITCCFRVADIILKVLEHLCV